MQDALGADSTDLNWSAQPSSNDLAPDCGLHFFPAFHLPPLNQAIAPRGYTGQHVPSAVCARHNRGHICSAPSIARLRMPIAIAEI